MSCKVAYCRFSYTHTTKSHQCGICKGFGHGQTECNSSAKKNALRQYYSDELPPSLWCDYLYCNCREYHETNSHFCKYCDIRHDDIDECIVKSLEKTNSIMNNDMESVFGTNENCYLTASQGMGCSLFIRKKNEYGTFVIRSLFMHSDMWGQYGDLPSTNHEPLYNDFINGLTNLGSYEQFVNPIHDPLSHPITGDLSISSSVDIIKCPLCRTESKKEDIIDVKGLSEKCRICLENVIDKCFTKCGHPCICKECLDQL